ncbi:MAG: hypothetical protein A4E19_09575 [Nitrospira sp. SG-bin1]|nr:MAG: hypothetical protein A4E19_09575 [Nitrospira sp. SG-bin1]
MNVADMSKVGLLSIITMAFLPTGPTGFASDQPGKIGMELKPKAAMAGKLNVEDVDEEVSHLEVVDSKGNAYLLIPLRTAGVNKPVVGEDRKVIVEYVHPYTGRLGN